MVTFSEISPSEFFYRNRDLAGFTNPARALYMAVRELVENSLDAAELAGMLPDVYVRIVPNDPTGENSNQEPKAYRVTVADNGPGVDPHHVPRAFGKVFYGSKYVLRQSRGMFGMGGTMAILYGQITTNRPVKITTSTDGKSRHIFEMLIDISENKPIILRKDTEEGAGKTGTRVDVILEGDFTRSAQKINEYFKQTALVGSYANLTFVDPIGRITTYERATESMPSAPKETLPHPHGVDVEALKRMIKITEEKTMERFMGNKHFHRVGETNAKKFLQFAGVDGKIAPEKLSNEQIVKVVDALQRYPEFLPPDASCLSPVGEQILTTGIIKELQPEFSTVVLRPPSSYSGFPFLVEVGLVYGGKVLEPGRKLFRFANRIPLLYDESSDVSFKVLNEEIDWRRYHVPDDAPVAVITHICLPSSERLLAKIDGKLAQYSIGDLIDTEIGLTGAKEAIDGVTYVVPQREIMVASVNPDTFKLEFVRAKRLMRRDGGPILRITAEEGRCVQVSPEHPLLVMTPGGLKTKRAVEIVKGDYLVGARRVPAELLPEGGEELDLVEGFAKGGLGDEVRVLGAKRLLYGRPMSQIARELGVPVRSISNWRRYDRMPLSVYLRLETEKGLRSSIRLLGRGSRGMPIPALIKVDAQLARLLGFYLAEGSSGCARNNYLSFSFHRDEEEFQRQVAEALVRVFGVSPVIDRRKRDKTVQITAHNKALALLFSQVWRAGRGSGSKAVPSFVFSAPRGFIEAMLDAYFAGGEGHFYRPTRHVQASGSSAELIEGLFVLSRMVGLETRVNTYGEYSRLEEVLRGEHYRSIVQRPLPSEIAKREEEAAAGAAAATGADAAEYGSSPAREVPSSALALVGTPTLGSRQHLEGRSSLDSRAGGRAGAELAIIDEVSEKLLTGDVQRLQVRRVEVLDYEGGYYNIETDRQTLPNYMHGYGILSHNCSTKVPYKTVGKEYIADRPEIESEIRNGVREALRRLSVFLSKKGSMEASQRKMNIYGKYLPLIAQFSTGLAGLKKEPRYKQLLEGEQEEVEEIKQALEEEAAVEAEKGVEGEKLIEQTTIEDYR